MIYLFQLTMPGCNSWNGKWSGECKVHAIIKNITGKKKMERYKQLIGSHSYDFGDGWRASVTVSEIDATEARRIRKINAGFCGYDWMVNDLCQLGRIRTLAEKMK